MRTLQGTLCLMVVVTLWGAALLHGELNMPPHSNLQGFSGAYLCIPAHVAVMTPITTRTNFISALFMALGFWSDGLQVFKI